MRQVCTKNLRKGDIMANEEPHRDPLALQRTLMAAERTYSAWVRTGLACIGGGFAIGKAFLSLEAGHRATAVHAGRMMILLGMLLFLYALGSYYHACRRLRGRETDRYALPVMIFLTIMLLVVSVFLYRLLVV